MEPDPTFIDVGILYLAALGLATALVVSGVKLVRRFLSSGLAGVWNSARYIGLGVGVTVGCAMVLMLILLGVAYGIGWVVHLLGWWPY